MNLRAFSLAAMLLCLSVGDLSGQRPDEAALDEVEQLREQVDSFVHYLLNPERYRESVSFFSESAFENPGLISAPCVGILPQCQAVSPKARMEGIGRFLEAFHKELAFGSQPETAPVLSTGLFERGGVDLEGVVIANDWRKDKYILGLLSRESIKSAIYPDDREEGERKFLFDALESTPPPYFNLVVVKSGDSEIPILLVWKREAGTWKIIHIDLICA